MTKAPTISLCMIAKNEEALIKNALDSVKDFVQEMIVVDTGSTDATRQIAQECGATVYDYKWENDFAKARNFALSMAKSDWVLVLDADECLTKKDKEDIKQLLVNPPVQQKENEEIVAFSFVSRHYTKERAQYGQWHALNNEEKQQLTKEFPVFSNFHGYYDVLYITRLFKNVKEIYYEGKVHEDVNPSIVAWHQKVPVKTIVQTPIPIHHLHFLKSIEYVQEKQRAYFALAKEKIKHTKDAKIALDVAVGYAVYNKDLHKSLEYVQETVSLQENWTQEKKKRIEELCAAGKQLRALHELITLLDMEKHDFNSIMNLAKAYYQIRAYRAAIVILKKLFEDSPDDLLVIEYLGVCYDQIGYVNDAIRVFEHGIVVHPTNAMFYFSLGALYEKIKDWKKAIAAFERAIEYKHALAAELRQRIEMLKKMQTGEHVHYNITMGEKK